MSGVDRHILLHYFLFIFGGLGILWALVMGLWIVALRKANRHV